MSNEFVFEKRNFLGIPPEFATLDKARFVVLPIPYERTTSYKKGTKYGPIAMIEASHQIELFDEELRTETWKAGVHTMAPVPLLERPADFFTSVANAVEPLVKMGKFLVSIGGEHAITEGPLSGVQRVHRKLSVFHVDAHCDLRVSYEGSPYNHACAAQRMLNYCDKIVQVGIRSVSEDEHQFTNTKRVRTFLMHENRDVAALLPKVLEELTDTVYVSIDLDGFDPAVVPGVGTPQPGGLSWYEGLDLLRAVIREKNVVAADVVELCPLEETVISELAAAKLVYRMMGWVAAKDRAAAEKKTARNSAGDGQKKTRRVKVEK
jgi:agmatinase